MQPCVWNQFQSGGTLKKLCQDRMGRVVCVLCRVYYELRGLYILSNLMFECSGSRYCRHLKYIYLDSSLNGQCFGWTVFRMDHPLNRWSYSCGSEVEVFWDWDQGFHVVRISFTCERVLSGRHQLSLLRFTKRVSQIWEKLFSTSHDREKYHLSGAIVS